MRRGLALTLLTVLGCAEPPAADGLVSDIVPGLRVRGAAMLTPDDHLMELIVFGDHVYAANSWGGVGVMHLDADGGLSVTDHGESEYGVIRCTSLALHEPSATLYCAGDSPPDIDPRVPVIERFDLSEPAQPKQLDPLPLQHWATRDIEVVGDRLLIHQFGDGLWTAAIAADGSLSGLEQLAIEGNARMSVVVGERVITAFADPAGRGTELRVFDPADWTELASLELDGPPLGLSRDSGGAPRLAVGLGSGGMAIVELDGDSLSLTRTLMPEAVVTHGLLDGELAVAITYSGAFAYDLSGGEARLFGFGAEGSQGEHRNGNMMHGLLHAGELIASDWTWVERWAIDAAGEPVDLDVPRGVHVGPQGPIVFQLRSFGEQRLRAEFWHRREHLFDREIEPAGLTRIELPDELRARIGTDEPTLHLGIRVFDPAVPSEGQPLSTSQFVVVQREADDPLPPAVGDSFPPVQFEDRDGQPFTIPLAEGTQTIWFTIDCALMWPEVEDLAWHARNGRDLGRGTAVLLTDTNLVLDGFAERFALDGLQLGFWGNAASVETAAANASYGEDIYQSFFVPDLPGDAVTMDYVIGGDGQVRSLERMYRGPYSLALPWPWE